MILARRDFLHGVLMAPAGGLLTPGRWQAGDRTVATGPELRATLRSVSPGTTIILAPGEFGAVASFEIAVPDVTLRAQVPQRSVLRAPLVIGGDRVKVEDLVFREQDDGGIHMVALRACADRVSITSPDVEIRGCDFGFFTGRGILVRPTGLRPYIHGCSFHDNRMNPISHNANEGIALGYDAPNQQVSMRARILGNRFWNMNIEGEVVSVKTSDNTIQGNQVSSSRGGFTNRFGQNNLFQDNTSINSRGIAIGGLGIRLIGNKVIGRGSIAVQAGTSAPGSRVNSDHPQSVDAYLHGNSGLLVIGGQYTPKPALRSTVASHSGQIRLKLHSGTRLPGR